MKELKKIILEKKNILKEISSFSGILERTKDREERKIDFFANFFIRGFIEEKK